MVDVNVRPDIDAAAAKLQSALGSKREIQRLPEVLWDGELVEMLATGVYGKWSGGMLMGTLTVFASGNKTEIKQMAKDPGKALADALRARLAGSAVRTAAAAAPQAAPAPAGGDIASRPATLDQLRTAGAITDEEYRDRRTKILDSL